MYNSQGILQASSARSNIVSVIRSNQGVGLPQQYENYNPENQQEVQENYDPQGDGIVSLRKLYFTMLVQIAIAITLNVLRIPFIENVLNSNQFLGFIFIGLFVVFALIASLPQFEQLPLNIVIYLLFGVNLYLLSSWMTIYFSIEQSLMAQLMIGGQILAQFLSVLQAKIELYFHQQALYVLASALIVFQLFIIYTGISFQEMILTLILGIIFGFLLIYGTQTKLRYNINDTLSGSVRAYFDVISVFLYTNKLLYDGMVQIRNSD